MNISFAEAYKLPIGEHVEKKGKFSYLSWCYAVRFLRENYPEDTWTIHENEQGLPVFSIGQSHMVKVTVFHQNKGYTQWHPILNSANKPIPEPTSFDINTSIHRGLTKAIGIATGIGLGLYAGEDLPKEETDEKKAISEAAKDKLEKMIDWFSTNGKTADDLLEWYADKTSKAAPVKMALNAEDSAAIDKYIRQIADTMKVAA